MLNLDLFCILFPYSSLYSFLQMFWKIYIFRKREREREKLFNEINRYILNCRFYRIVIYSSLVSFVIFPHVVSLAILILFPPFGRAFNPIILSCPLATSIDFPLPFLTLWLLPRWRKPPKYTRTRILVSPIFSYKEVTCWSP